MPFASHSGVRLFWRLDGANDRPAIILLNSIGMDITLWDTTVPHLIDAFRVVRLDSRGHGASDAPEGDYTLSMLADDVIRVMDAARIDRTAIAGVSLGGMIAMELALRYPERVLALALICTSANMDREVWNERVATVRGRRRDLRSGNGPISFSEVHASPSRDHRKRTSRAVGHTRRGLRRSRSCNP